MQKHFDSQGAVVGGFLTQILVLISRNSTIVMHPNTVLHSQNLTCPKAPQSNWICSAVSSCKCVHPLRFPPSVFAFFCSRGLAIINFTAIPIIVLAEAFISKYLLANCDCFDLKEIEPLFQVAARRDREPRRAGESAGARGCHTSCCCP